MTNTPSKSMAALWMAGWLSLTTHKGVQDFAFNKDQALLIAKTIKETAERLAKPKTS